MSRFLVSHSVVFSEEPMKELAKKPLPEGVSWMRTFCGFEDNKSFCEWQAPSREAIKEVLRQVDVSYDAIYPVRLFDVPTGSLEP
jgi:hypothetical protein